MELIPGLPDDIARECLIRVSHSDFPQIASTCRHWRSELHLPHFSSRRRAVGSTQTILVFSQARVQPVSDSDSLFGSGSSKLLATPSYRLTSFEPGSGEWSELKPGLGDRLPMFCHVVRVGSELLVVGGWDPTTWTASNKVYIYDFVRASWRRGKDIPGAARSFFACAASEDSGDRVVYVAGGHDDQKNALRSAAAYDVARDEWTEMPEMAAERDECRGIFRGGKFHVIGGYSTEMQGRFDRGAETFDPSTWQWDRVDEQFLESAACPRTCSAGAGGEAVYMCRDGRVAEMREDAWKEVAEVPAEVKEIAGVVTWRGKVMVIGSPRFGGAHAACVLDTARYTWTRVSVPEEFTGHVQSGCCLEL